jgi:hypothetical protein
VPGTVSGLAKPVVGTDANDRYWKAGRAEAIFIRSQNARAVGRSMRNLPKSFEELLDQPYPWPKKGDRLLRQTKDWNTGVGFSNDGVSRHVHIWDGYMSAGEALVEDCRRNPQARHFLIYPILFVYRHALELAMKWILTMYGGYDVNGIAHHDLWQLWKLSREVIDKAGDYDGSTDTVEAITKEMHDLDKSALAFRYGIDKNNKPPKLPEGLYDPENIRNVMTAVRHFFDGTDGMLSDLAGAQP